MAKGNNKPDLILNLNLILILILIPILILKGEEKRRDRGSPEALKAFRSPREMGGIWAMMW